MIHVPDTRKRIYTCDFQDCRREFVRQDLRARHQERHTTKGSNLQRKDKYIPQVLVNSTPKVKIQPEDIEVMESTYQQQQQQQQQQRQQQHQQQLHQPVLKYEASSAIIQSPTESMGPPRNNTIPNETYPAPSFQAPTITYKTAAISHRSNSDSYYGDVNATTQLNRNHTVPYTTSQQPRHASFGSVVDPTGFRPPHPPPPPLPPTQPPITHADTNPSETMQWNGQPRISIPMQNHNSGYNGYTQQYTTPTISAISSAYPHPQTEVYPSQPYYNNAQEYLGQNSLSESMATTMQEESPQNEAFYSYFGEDMTGRSPSTIPPAFEDWLLNHTGSTTGQHNQGGMHDFVMDPTMHLPFGLHTTIPPQTLMSVNSLLEAPSQKASISERKRQELIDLIESSFNDGENSPSAVHRSQLLCGDSSVEGHVLSRQSMQQYIRSYWYHFHDQMPILHRPTFSAETCPNLLLLAVLAIGAANLDKPYGQVVISAAVGLANFLAWHLRSKLFDDYDFRPTTSLWVLQSLILLECYEKLYSSRALHERSTIHHATTISSLRRGSALLGGSALDSPRDEDDKQFFVSTGDPNWDRWITDEATKRVAYALFIIDSTHAIMFGHTSVMLAHEIRLTLPCDEALWTANSGLEVSRLDKNIRSEVGKPILFPDGLKRTLGGRPVRTNRFGRTALMAGLLNVTFHLGQRDIQARSLGVIGTAESSWRMKLTHAFDTWEKDWDNDHEPSTASKPASRHIRDGSYSSSSTSTIDEEHTFESRVVLHHLAHMGMHVDIVQCQIYAKAKRLLGRPVTLDIYNSCAKRMKSWAGRASARDAVYYSLKFLEAVLTPDISQGSGTAQKPPPFRTNRGEYVPRDDYLLNRPWIVYFAALVVWSYGYALDGPLDPSAIPPLTNKEDYVADMRAFLIKVGSISEPNALVELAGVRNSSAGLLCFLSAQFADSRWELMQEAGNLLSNCVQMLCSRGAEVGVAAASLTTKAVGGGGGGVGVGIGIGIGIGGT